MSHVDHLDDKLYIVLIFSRDMRDNGFSLIFIILVSVEVEPILHFSLLQKIIQTKQNFLYNDELMSFDQHIIIIIFFSIIIKFIKVFIHHKFFTQLPLCSLTS